MLRIRVVKTGSGAKAVQAVVYLNNKREVIKHFGSCHTEPELSAMIVLAEDWVRNVTGQTSFFQE